MRKSPAGGIEYQERVWWGADAGTQGRCCLLETKIGWPTTLGSRILACDCAGKLGLAPQLNVPVLRLVPDQGIRPGEKAPVGFHSTYIQRGPRRPWCGRSDCLPVRPCCLAKDFLPACVGPLLPGIGTGPAGAAMDFTFVQGREPPRAPATSFHPSPGLFSSRIPLTRDVILSLPRI